MKLLRVLFECLLAVAVIFAVTIIRSEHRELQESKTPLGALANLADDASLPKVANALRSAQHDETSRIAYSESETRKSKIESRTSEMNLRQTTAVESLFVISVAERTYRDSLGSGRWYADSLATLSEAGLIDAKLAAGVRAGYRFSYWRPESRTSYSVTADPEDGIGSHYFIDQTRTIRIQADSTATEASPALLPR